MTGKPKIYLAAHLLVAAQKAYGDSVEIVREEPMPELPPEPFFSETGSARNDRRLAKKQARKDKRR